MNSKIALLSCSDMSNFVSDDGLLLSELQKLPGVYAEFVSWSQVIDWSKYHVAVIRTTWDYTFHLTRFLEVLEQIEGAGVKLYNSLSTVRWNSNKKYLIDLSQRGVRIVPTIHVVQGSDLSIAVKEMRRWNSQRIVIKPSVGANADQVRIVPIDEGETSIKFLSFSRVPGWLIQPFVEEIKTGEISLHFFDGAFSHGIKKVPAQGDFRVQEEHGGTILPYRPLVQELDFGRNILGCLDERVLYGRVDFVNIDGIPYLMELELIEPSLYFRTHPESAAHFAHCLIERIKVG